MKAYNENTGEFEPDPEPAPGGLPAVLDERERGYGPRQIYSDFPLADPELEGTGIIGGALARLKEAENRFENAYFQLQQIGPAVAASGDASAAGEYSGLVSHADMVRAGLKAIADGSATALDYAKNVFGLGAVRGLARRRSRGGKLGAIPLLPAAAIIGAIGIVIAASNSMMQFVVNWRRAEAGKGAVPGSGGGGIPETVAAASDLVKWLAIGAVIFYAAPPLLKFIEARK